MISLMDRLRLYAQQLEDQNAPDIMTIAMREAAREIGSLQTELGIEREYSANIHDENLDNIAEIDRLRAALEGVVREWKDYYGEFGGGDVPFVVALTMAGIACAALDEGKAND